MSERVKEIQRKVGVAADGILGPITIEAIAKALGLAAETKAGSAAQSVASSLPSLLVEIATGQLGVAETSRNQGPGIEKYWTATSYPEGYADRQPWCAAFMCWVFLEASKKAGFLPFKLPKTAAAFGFETWAKDNGLTLQKSPQRVRRGDVVVYTFSHIGIAVTDSDAKGNFEAIEGNTNAAGDREGGGVMRKVRKLSSVCSAIGEWSG